MGAPFSLQNTMRRHDEAFSLWLRGLTVDYGNLGGSAKPNHPILQTMSAPQRAFSEMHNTLVKQGFITGADAAAQKTGAGLFAVLPLPFASWERGDPLQHAEYEGVPKRFRKQVFDQGTLQHIAHPWPGMYQTEYRVTLWCLKRYTEVHMREWVYSEIGKIGTAHSEVWLDIPHSDPWGTLKQALKFTGSSDLSSLEGEEDQRYFRFEYSFTLNTIHFRLPSDSQPYMDTVITASSFTDAADGVLAEADPLGQDLIPAVESGNLYQPYAAPANVATRWPVAGNATVGISSLAPNGVPARSALALGLNASTDIVDLANKPMHLDASGRSVLHVSFQLLSDAAVGLDIFQNDGLHTPPAAPSWQSVLQVSLPPTTPWKRASFLTLVTQPIFDVSVRGTGVAAVARLAQIIVRRVLPATDIATSTGPIPGFFSGALTMYTWTGLQKRPYLLIVELTGVGSGLVDFRNDLSASSSALMTLDSSQNKGAVLLMQPLNDSLVLQIDPSLPIAPPVVQRYDGTYAGHEL